MNFDQYDFVISEHWLSALINGDESGLTDEESEQLETFIADLPRSGYWNDGESAGFARCEITGMHSECVHASYFFPDSGRA